MTPRITIFTSDRGALCKRFSLRGGQINVDAIASFFSGSAHTADVPTAAALNAELDRLSRKQAISIGLLKKGWQAHITTATNERNGGGVARTLSNFAFPQGAGWLPWDYDSKSMPADVRQRVADLGGPVEAFFHL